MKKFYITTPIYYVNDRPHVGHAYTTTAADALARFHRLRGVDVFFSVGVDENSQKNVQAMEAAGEKDLTSYLDKMAREWKKTWDDLDISYDDFIRTTSAEHQRAVVRFWEAVKKSGDIYEGTYEGVYCVGCEAFKTQSDIGDGRCLLHPNKELQKINEKNYFFRASRYRDALLKLINEDEQFVRPEARRNEVRNYIKDHLADFSISREAKNLQVGIPVPGDDSQRIYVWFDALINYLSIVGYGTDDGKAQAWWPADLQLVGKDIIKFHCALWPAMIMSAAKNDEALRREDGLPCLPRSIFAHGFFTIEGQKISKSLGHTIDPRELTAQYGFDALRYYMLRDIPFGDDGDFSRARLEERYIHDLSHTLGNLVNRAVAMSRRYFDGRVPESKGEGKWTFAGQKGVRMLAEEVEKAVHRVRFDLALEAIWNELSKANKFIEDTQPFKLVKTDKEAVGEILYSLLEYCRAAAWLIEPVLPTTAEKIIRQLGQHPETESRTGMAQLLIWGGLKSGAELPEPAILFPPIVD